MGARTGLKFDPGQLPNNYVSPGTNASGVVVANGPVRLIAIRVFNNNAGIRYFQFFDATSVPADTAVPTGMFVVPAGTSVSSDYGAQNEHGGRSLNNGLCWANSSTAFTKTLSGSTDLFVEITWE